jgi:hypothetical protein
MLSSLRAGLLRFAWVGRHGNDRNPQATRRKVFQLAVSPRNIDLADFKDAGIDRKSTPNHPRRRAGGNAETNSSLEMR